MIRNFAGVIRVGGVACIVLSLLASCSSQPDTPRNVVLVSVDSLRADYLGSYGNLWVQTPNLDRFAADGVRFDDVTSAAPSTLAGHASMLTGRYAHTHGSARDGFPIHPNNPLLPVLLRDEGYETAAFVSTGILAVRDRLRESFDTFGDAPLRQTITGMVRPADRVDADQVMEQVERWIEQPHDAPYFLFVQLSDPSFPFSPPERFADLYRSSSDPSRLLEWDHDDFALAQQRRFTPNPRGRAGAMSRGLDRNLITGPDGSQLEGEVALANLYAGAVSYIDDQLGRLFKSLRDNDQWNDTLVIVTSDHGETFWEHGDFWSHGLALYQTTVHVPLMMHGPGVMDGTEVETPVSSIDLAPTILEALRIIPPPAMEGEGLMGAARGQLFQRGPIYSEATFPVGPVEQVRGWINRGKAKTIRRGPWKLIWTPYLEYAELYNIELDPGERQDLLRNPGPEHVRLRDEMLGQLRQWTASARPLPSQWEWDSKPATPPVSIEGEDESPNVVPEDP